MAVTTRRQSGLPLATAAVTRSQTSRGMHGPSRTALIVPGGSGRDRGQATGPRVGTPKQRRNDPMDEEESHVDQGRSDAVQYYGMQRDVALESGFERVSIDRERVQREGPGEVESLVAAPKTPIPEPQPLLCAAPPWLQEPPESWYQYTPHFSRTPLDYCIGAWKRKENHWRSTLLPIKVIFNSAHRKDTPTHSQQRCRH